MENVDLILNDLFSESENNNDSRVSLDLIAESMAPLRFDALILMDANGTMLAHWITESVERTKVPDSLRRLYSAANIGDELLLFDDDSGSMQFIIRVESAEIESGFLAGRITPHLQPGELESKLRSQLNSLKVSTVLALIVCRQSSEHSATEARLRQLTRQHQAFQEEHHRSIVMHMETANERIKEQLLYMGQLEQAKLAAEAANSQPP